MKMSFHYNSIVSLVYSCYYISITPLYNFFIKNIVQDFLMYNEFDQNITKESDPVRQKHYTMKKH